MDPKYLRQLLHEMPRREQIWAGALGEVLDVLNSTLESGFSESWLIRRREELYYRIVAETGLDAFSLEWLLAFLAAGPSVSADDQPPAVEPSPASRGTRPADVASDQVAAAAGREPLDQPAEWPDGGYEGLNAALPAE